MRTHRNLFVGIAALTAAAVPATAQVQTLLLEGDNVPGVGNVTVIRNLALNDVGDWLVEVRTDNPSTAADVCVLKNGALYMREGQALTQPAGATIVNFNSMTLDAAGNSAMDLTLGGLPANRDSGVFWNDKLVLQEGDISSAAFFGPNTPYLEFRETRINNANQILLICTVDDPTITGGPERALIRLDLDAQGNLLSETAIVVAGDTLGQVGAPMVELSLFQHHFSFNDSGVPMYYARVDSGQGGHDDLVMLGNQAIAEESLPSPIAGRNWGSVSTPELDLNNNGDWAMAGTLDGSTADNQVIFKNAVKIVQKADPVPGLPSFSIQTFGSGPVEISESGDVLWYGDWDDSNTAIDSGLFVNTTLTVQEGVTMTGTNVITKLVGLVDGYHMSPSGGFILFEGTIDTGLDGVFRVAAGEPGSSTCFGDGTGQVCPCGNFGGAGEGCQNSTSVGGKLGALGSASLSAASLNFTATNLPAGRFSLLISGSGQSNNLYGDGLGCLSTPWTYHGVRLSSGNGSAVWNSAATANVPFAVGQTGFFQVIFRDPAGICGTGFNTTAAYQVTFAQ